MVELIVAITILSFGIIGIYSVFSPFVTLTNNIPFRFAAVYLAEEGLEIVKNIRDNNFVKNVTWSQGLTICSQGCQADYKAGTSVQTSLNQLKPYLNIFLMLNNDGFYSYDSGFSTKFKRKIIINQISDDILEITVQVFWDYNGQLFSFETQGNLYNWY